MEILVVGEEQILCAAVFQRSGEDLLAQLIQRDVGDSGHALGSTDVPDGTGGGLEHNRIGDDGGGHHAGHLLAGHQTSVLEHGGDDGIGRADRLIADINGVVGLDICQTVVVDDLQDLCLLQTGNGLGGFVVVHQYDPLSSGTQQMVTGQNAHYFFLVVQNGIAMLSELQNLLLDLVQTVFQMEAHQILGAADTAGGRGLEQQTGSTVGIVGGGDDAGGGGKLAQLLVQLCLTQHQTVYVHLQSSADHIRLVAAQNDGIRLVKQQVFPALGQRDGDLAAEQVSAFTGFVEHLALQSGQNIEQRDLV